MSDLSGDLVIDDDNFYEYLPENDTEHAFGLVPRDFSRIPVGSIRGVEKFSMDIIARDRWPGIIKDSEQSESRLSDLFLNAGNESLDQNGQGYCVTEDSEYLTVNGWVNVADYNGGPVATICPHTQRMQFQYPSIVHRYEYSGEMIYSTNRRIDFGVTPDHRMYVRKWDEAKRTLSPDYSFTNAKNLGWYMGLLAAPAAQIGTHIEELAVPGHSAFTGDDFFALLGLIVSDGFAGGAKKNQNVVSFASFRGIESVEALAYRCGFRRKASNGNVWICTSHDFARWIREHCYTSSELGSKSKCVPRLVMCATPRQIKIFLEYFNDRNREGSQFYSGSKRLIDDLQELHLRIGIRSSIGLREPRRTAFQGNKSGFIQSKLPQYVLTVSKTERLCIERKKHIEQDKYNGMVYCVTVPNGTIVTRRNGSVLFSGNCWAYSPASAIMVARARDNQTPVRLSAHAVACKIKNFRDQGGWNPQAAAYAVEHGYPSVQAWPEKSMSRSHDTAATWADAAQYKVTEGFWDLQASIYDRNLAFDQLATCLLSRVPCPVDFNWWGHSVCAVDLVEVDSSLQLNDIRRWGVRILNSWRKTWGTNGFGVLRGNKGVPDGATAIKVTG